MAHADDVGFVTSLVAVQAMIAVVGLAAAAMGDRTGGAARAVVELVSPGLVGRTLTRAITYAHESGESQRYLALASGSIGSLVTGTSAMAELQRSLTRVYGLQADRPTVRRYRLAALHAVTAGVLLAAAFAIIALGDAIGPALGGLGTTRWWAVVRIAVGALFTVVAVTLLFHRCPNRCQPTWTWLLPGALVSVGLWVAVTALLNAVLRANRTFGDVYGPLAGVVALMLWSYISSLAMLYGGAVSAELETHAGLAVSRSST